MEVQSSPLIRSCVLLIVNKAMIIGRLVQVLLLEHINDKERILYSWPALSIEIFTVADKLSYCLMNPTNDPSNEADLNTRFT